MNIFENAKFGDKFRTRNGRMAVYYSRTLNYFGFVLIHQKIGDLNHACIYEVDCLGEVYHELDKGTDDLDIISKWQDPINEEELDNMATLYRNEVVKSCNYNKDELCFLDIDKAYIAGYRAAKEQP